MTLLDLDRRSPYLSGAYEPILDEITAVDLEVEGDLPSDLEGSFVRTGANPRFEPKGRYHWFDGDGMLHGVELGGGTATYRNRFVRTAGLAADEAAGECGWTGILEPPDFSKPGGPFKNTANTDLVFHHGRLLALWWLGGEPYAVDVPSLDTVGVDSVPGGLASMSAHPKVDPRTGELVWFDYSPLPPYLTYGVADASGAVTHRVDIELDGPRLQHDIAITERYSLLFDMSMGWDLEAMAKGRTRIRFDRESTSRIGVIERTGSTVRWFDVASMFTYHTINAWEEVGPDGHERIVLVGCRIGDPLVGDPGNPEGADGPTPVPTIANLRLEPYLHRWELDLTTGSATERQLDDRLTEFPRMDNRVLGARTHVAYSPRIATDRPELAFDGVIRYDTDTGVGVESGYGDGWFGGETTFAPRVGAGAAEDDGYVLTFASHEATGESALLVLDAARVADGPVARVRIPQLVPAGYHSWWVGGDDLASSTR